MSCCLSDAAPHPNSAVNSSALPETLYLISGSFSAIYLYVLAFNTRTRVLSVESQHTAFGPHQWITMNTARDRLYATTWAWPPALYSWKIETTTNSTPTISLLNQAFISATSSYITAMDSFIYSVGGHSGEVHRIHANGGFGERIQELMYVPPEEFASMDKSRKALRVGSHGIEFTNDGKAFVPHLGTNSIWVYERDAETGRLELVNEVESVREHDGPRHVLPHPNGRYLYVVTEHTSFIDLYEIISRDLTHRQSASLIPADRLSSDFRGDTLKFSRRPELRVDSEPPFLFATTRGMDSSRKGFLAAIALDADGLMLSPVELSLPVQPPLYQAPLQADIQALHLFETPTSGGKANVITVAPYSSSSPGNEGVEWLALTDDEEGYVFIIEWSAGRGTFEEIARVKLGLDEDGNTVTASQAVWLG